MTFTKKVETKSLKDLAREGYKEGKEGLYLGDARYPTHTIRQDLHHLLGKKLDLVTVEENKVKIIDVEGNQFWIPLPILKTKIKKFPIQRKMFLDSVCKFNGYNFEFPCDMRRADIKDAVDVAKWVLKMAKVKK